MSFYQFRTIKRGEFFVIAGDTSTGAGDWSTTQFLSKNGKDVPLVYRTKSTATEMTNEIHPIIEKLFDVTGIKPVVAYERNNGGSFEMDRLGTLNRLGKYTLFEMNENRGNIEDKESRMYGWDTNTATRPKMLGDLQEVINKRLLKIYDEVTINEMFSFIKVRTSTLYKAQADKGAHDDHVMSLAIAWQLYLYTPTLNQVQAYRTGGRGQFPSVDRTKRESKTVGRFGHVYK